MRISKPPEERRQEMIDTAMKVFGSRGYEAVTMTDIAKEMNVVPGLCYRYFRSKEELYQTALIQYAGEAAAPMIQIMDGDYDSVEEYAARMAEYFQKVDKKEKYHDFFHRKGNEMFHYQLEYMLISILEPHFVAMLERMKSRGLIKVQDCQTTGLFILHGQMPVMNNDTLDTKDKLKTVHEIIHKILF